MRPMLAHTSRPLFLVSLVALAPVAGCGGELYLNADDAVTEFDPFDRDPTDDEGDGGDGANGDDSGDGADVDGDSLLGDGFGDFDGDGGGGGCGFNPDPCPSGQECVEGACVTVCPVERCAVSRACCASGTECVFDRFCLPACPSSADQRCGSDGSVCCNSAANEICGPALTCVQDCTGQGPLCGTGTQPSFGTVCCDGNDQNTTEDDDVCVFNKCVQRGDACETFLDCEPGEYCEPTLGYCLPNDFPPDAPICQAAPTDLFTPVTEWSWVGVQLIADGDAFDDGEVIPKCADAAATHCYREPCTTLPTATGAQDATLRADCYRSVETIPTTADINQADDDPVQPGVQYVPEVAFKAYADNTFGGMNLLVIVDGRSEEALPASGTPSKQQRTKAVVYGGTRGHLAIGNLDGDPQLEIAEAHSPGLCVYDPYDSSGVPVANALRGSCLSSGSLNTNYTGGAPHLVDFDGDGDSEIVIAGVVIGYNGTAPSVLLDLGAGNQGGESNTGGRCGAGQDCFFISAVADVNRDNFPEILTGDKAWTIRFNPTSSLGVETFDGTDGPSGWQADRIWTASGGAFGATPNGVNLGRGFPGVANFVDNSAAPYCTMPPCLDTPEVAVVYDGDVYIVSGETGEVLRSPIANVPLAFQLLANRGGPPNIADFDGDGRVEVSFAGTGCMVVVDPDCAAADAAGRVALASTPGSGCNVPVPGPGDPPQRICNIEVMGTLAQEVGVLWQYQTQDQSSAVTGTSVFDFQGDLKAEVLYNDECFFRVFEGSTSNILYERPNSHRTATEYPIVVDVDGDSNSEIVVVSTGDQSSKNSGDRDRCGGPARNASACVGADQQTCESTGGCAWNGMTCLPCTDATLDTQVECDPFTYGTPFDCGTYVTEATCVNTGSCGWNGTACVSCPSLNSATLCDPAQFAPINVACTTRPDGSNACYNGGGGCGLNGANECVACSNLTTQALCTTNNTSSGCQWTNNSCVSRVDCGGILDGSDGGTDIANECNATQGCVWAAVGGANVCVRQVNGCAWTGSACVRDCARVFDSGDLGTTVQAECNGMTGCGYAAEANRCGRLTNGCVWESNTCTSRCETTIDGPADGDTNFNAECSAYIGCDSLLGACREYSYRRNEWEQYRGTSACNCSEYTTVATCNAARGCQWSGSCQVVTAADCGTYTTRETCQQHMDDCLWDAYEGAGGACEENPRGQAYVCTQSTWGVTAFGDPSDQWVRTLPYWYEHPFHITNQDRIGNVVPDWTVCYPGPQCAAQTVNGEAACEATTITGSTGPLCSFGDPNPDFYNNFRQNVPGFVPLNAPDLQIEAAIGGLANCPPQVTIIARIVNKGRAGILAGTPIGFYRLTSESQTVQATAATAPFATVALPVDLLPGGGVEVSAVYTVPASEAPINLDFRVIANPAFILSQPSADFECNANNNFRDVLDLDCTDVGG